MTLTILIADYLQQVEKCLALFETKFGRRDLVRAWREGVVPQTGELAEGIVYQMHGVGCGVEYPDYDVDFDFATRDEVGFDAWRLWMFANQFPNRYPEYQDRTAVEAAVDALLAEGTATRVDYEFPGEVNSKLLMLELR